MLMIRIECEVKQGVAAGGVPDVDLVHPGWEIEQLPNERACDLLRSDHPNPRVVLGDGATQAQVSRKQFGQARFDHL
jgi:hypothetical protein